jgi:hypothetical protein
VGGVKRAILTLPVHDELSFFINTVKPSCSK